MYIVVRMVENLVQQRPYWRTTTRAEPPAVSLELSDRLRHCDDEVGKCLYAVCVCG